MTSLGAENIPRIIHYCWFGHGPKPKLVARCLNSWRKHLNGYTIMEWNESNFDIGAVPYVKEAYEARKFAFVSDYVRLHALARYGGIYMDTDVEALRPLDKFLTHDAFSGFEDETFLQSGTMGAAPGHPWIRELLADYEGRSFLNPDGTFDMTTNTNRITAVCLRHGLVQNGRHQVLGNGVVMYPRTFFSPFDYINGKSFLSEDSYTIHHFALSWLPAGVRARSRIKRIASRILGPRAIAMMRKVWQHG